MGDQEADEVARWPDRQLAEGEIIFGPVRERLLPRELDQ